jgi:hypothetical protein
MAWRAALFLVLVGVCASQESAGGASRDGAEAANLHQQSDADAARSAASSAAAADTAGATSDPWFDVASPQPAPTAADPWEGLLASEGSGPVAGAPGGSTPASPAELTAAHAEAASTEAHGTAMARLDEGDVAHGRKLSAPAYCGAWTTCCPTTGVANGYFDGTLAASGLS